MAKDATLSRRVVMTTRSCLSGEAEYGYRNTEGL
jgi:hypothetical protein